MFITVFTQVVILMILVGVGVVLQKGGVLTEAAVKGCTDMVLILVTPCVIIKSFIRKFDTAALKGLLISFLIAFLIHIGFIIFSRLIFRSGDDARRRVLQFAVVFSNCGFMSLPLQEALLGDDGVFYGSSFIAIFNLFVWSYGILTISGDRKFLSPRKVLINPGIIGIVAGLIIFLFSVPVPAVISQPVSYIAGLNTPLPMIIIGYHLANSDIINAFKDKACLFAVLLRLLLFPAVALAVLYFCGIRNDLLVSIIISASAPTAAITTMFSAKYNGDTALSVSIVSLSTVCSVITMPLLITAAQYLAV